MNKLRQPFNLEDIQARTERMKAIAIEQEAAKIIQLPIWHEGKRGSPNSFIRSALFAAIQSKDRIYLENTTLFSQQGITVKFTGKQLNQEDMTVWLALVDLARQHPLGNECSLTAYSILKHMGLQDGGRERERLQSNIERLTACLIKIEGNRYVYGGSLVENFWVDKDTKLYKITLNRELIQLFGKNDWTAINWEQRKQLRQKPLASKLHEYYSSHEYPMPVKIDFLHNITGSSNKDKYGFKAKLKAALDALININFLENYNIEGNLVSVKRVIRRLPSAKTSR
jgi:hypothetical protein